jgi:hypothetical protein
LYGAVAVAEVQTNFNSGRILTVRHSIDQGIDMSDPDTSLKGAKDETP